VYKGKLIHNANSISCINIRKDDKVYVLISKRKHNPDRFGPFRHPVTHPTRGELRFHLLRSQMAAEQQRIEEHTIESEEIVSEESCPIEANCSCCRVSDYNSKYL